MNSFRFSHTIPIVIGLNALLVSIAWLTGWIKILQPLPKQMPMQFTTALCFLATASICLLERKNYPKAKGAAILFIIALSLHTLLAHFGQIGSTLNNFFTEQYKDLEIEGMGVNSSIGFFLICLNLILLNTEKKALFKVIISILTLTIGMVGLYSVLFQNKEFYHLLGFSCMSFQSSIGFILIGSNFTFDNFKNINLSKKEFFIIGIILGICCFILDLGFPKEIGGGLMYILLPLLAFYCGQKKEIISLTILALLFNLSGFIYNYFENQSNYILYNRALITFIILIISALLNKIKDGEIELVKNKRFFESIFENSNDSLIIFNEEGIIKKCNQTTLNFFQFDEKNIIHSHISIILKQKLSNYMFSDGKFEEEKFNRFCRINNNIFKSEFNNKYVRPSLFSIQLDKRYFVLILSDISLIEEQNKKIRDQTSSLLEINNELKNFIYIVCHDLEEPLRSVKAFSNLSKEKFAAQIPDKLQTYLNFIQESVERMESLIQDLSDYSNLGKKKSLQMADINQIVKSVLTDLSSLINETKVKFEIDELPELFCYKNELRLVFQNLIHNALKFNKEKDDLKIKIKHNLKNSSHEFFVEDNGKGIHEDFHEKIFKVFQRADTAKEKKGNGIGLAICNKVVKMHEGKINLNSSPNNGAQFKFTINHLKPSTDE